MADVTHTEKEGRLFRLVVSSGELKALENLVKEP